MDKPKVLIIDDEPLILKSTSMILEYSNMIVVTAKDGEEGMFLAKSSSPDIILLDIMMPGLSGWSVLESLKADSSTSSIPVIVFTAKECSADEKVKYESLYCDLILKPFKSKTLVEKIDLHLYGK